MICCINPNCEKPENPDGQTYCISCGVKLVPILRNRFRMIKFLGQGGFGRTYLAEDIDKLNLPCVVKQLAPNVQGTWAINKAVELFQQEAKQLQQLGQHPQIPSLDAYFEQDNYLYLVQQFVDGDNLLNLFQNQGIWPENQVKQLLLELLPVLNFIHEQKIIHRDINPQNIMRRRSDGVLMLIDFGVSKQLSGTAMSRLGTQIGTPGYSPFEQMKGGEAYPASDLFSLGATAFHLLTGLYPFDLWVDQGYSWTGNWQQHLKSPIEKGLELILSKLLAKDIQQRYQSAEEVLIDFQHHSRQTPPPTPTPAPTLKRFDFDPVTVEVRGNISSRQRCQAQFYSENLGSGAILDMVAIPGGSFVMGSPNTEAGRSNNEGPQRTVNISPFFMGKYPITQEQWEVVMGNNPSDIKGLKRPVEQVSWNNALEFCQKISQKTGKIYRLPSEAEWEYACRAGTTTPFYFGETITPNLVNYDGNYPYGAAPKGRYRKQTTDVGSFPPNPFGLYDMHGNVWEWCSDKWHDNYSGAPTDGSSWETATDNKRVLRGGSWNNHALYSRSADRDRNSAGYKLRNWGFRVAVASVSSSS
ncbi:bifunctional serine/threonine-protein kinase/formylglycine-generating enzyme family protein [Microcoleus sp. w1-18aA5]|uniref:bifunctional serine/threonine-protein kinase/formylglycine-generating enzyme family protein n=1 Tax=Microcoleus sp. w1-18aA5 TaxID=2818982 RepID=UPI002FD252A1